MALFRNRREEIDEEELEELEKRRFNRRKFKDLKPEYKRKRKEPPKPWGKKERIIVLSILLLTVTASLFLDLSSRNFKLPGLPRLKFVKPSFDIFKGETIIIGNRQEDQAVMKEKIIKEFKDKTKELSGVYALYVFNLDDSYSFGVGEDEVMQAASLIKLPVMALVYSSIQECPDLIGDELNADMSSSPGGCHKENLEEKYGNLVESMGKRSDNVAFNTLVKYFGEEKIQDYIASLGMNKTSLAKNETNPHDIGLFFTKLWKDEIVPRQARDKILGFLTDTAHENWLGAGIPDEVKVSHKFGREVHVVNDAGIVFAEKPFVLVLMSDGIVETEADKILPELAGIVYREMVK